ncbi:J domain-containing protein [Agromyces sp. SYSU T0242]|uniref:J domain-containing protein n=1 Tax=Agromyces litoreus TaxID=3158561 RepID=UPI00339345F7
MPDSPLSDSPYEVLGVPADADLTTLRAAYRRALRHAHPDTGGDAEHFHAVQRAWELVGTPEARAAFDRGSGPGMAEPQHAPWAPSAPRPRRDSRPLARTYGHPGGWSRQRYLDLIREWAGRGVTLDDPYDPALVRSAPRDIRHVLADALAEEETARSLSTLGIAYTVWHDLATDAAGPSLPPKLDHLVLGPTGLIAIQSEDWGGPVAFKRGELVGEALAGERPMRELAARAKSVTRPARVKPTALVVAVPDDDASTPLEIGGSVRGAAVALVRRSRLASAIREGIPGAPVLGGSDAMEVRARLQAAVRFA